MILCEPFQVIVVPENARESVEQMGSKEKFWFTESVLGWSLYKVARSETGEDWSEKIAEQFANLLGLPHARYELAVWHDPDDGLDTRGVVTPTLVPKGGRLISGNELLVAQVKGYPMAGEVPSYRVRQHTLDNVLGLIGQTQAGLPPGWEAPEGVHDPTDLFLGYLLLDAWTGNTDRHHENWAFIEEETGRPDCAPVWYLAPTFDHASCLGRELKDADREERLRSRDARRSVAAYAAKAHSALYGSEVDKRPLTSVEAFRRVASMRPAAGRVWLERLAGVNEDNVTVLFSSLPADRISLVASEFAQTLLRENRKALLVSKE